MTIQTKNLSILFQIAAEYVAAVILIALASNFTINLTLWVAIFFIFVALTVASRRRR